ncbi:MAG: hypothetical protein KDB00_30235 [Planctomycetales bacterium]|nr:hypothetical protein [Planctomycetales bacterium]
MKARARDPQDRCETAASLADDLLRFGDGRAILARPDGPTKKAWRGIRKRPWTSVIAAVSLCAFSVILASFLTVRHKTQRISELRNAFAGQLRDLEFAPIEIAHDKVTQLSALVGRLDAISPAEAARASDSIDRELTRYVQTNAASSVLEDADIPRLRELVSMIGGKRSVDAGHLNTLLDSAQRGWIPSLQLDGSIERLEDALPATLFTRQGERLLRSKENTGSGTAFSALATTTVPSVGDCRLQATFSVPVDLQRPVGMSIDTVEYQEGAFSNIAFSPDGRWLAASSWGAVRVWDVENRSIVCEFGGKHRIVNMEFSVDGACLFLPDHSNHVRVYSLPEGREIGSFTTASDLFHVSPSRDQFVTVEGAMFVLHSIVGTELIPLRQFDIRADQADLVTKPSEIGHLAFADDARIVTIDNSGIVSLWNTQTGSRIDSFESSVTEATAVAVSGSANMIAIGTPNDGVVVWDWGKGQHHRLSHGGRIQLLRFTGKGTDPLLSSASAYKACIWNLTDYQRVHERIVDLTMWGNRTWISHGDQITIASGLEIERWNTREGAVQLLSSRPHDVRAFALHEGTRTMATADSDRVIHLLDLETARDLGQLGGSQYSVQVTPMSAGLFNLSLLRHGAVVGESHVKLPIQDELYSLTLVAERLQGRLRVWVNGEPDTDTPNLVFDDLWKSTNGNLGKFGLYVPETSSVANVRSYSRKDADFRTLWHFANEAFAGGNYRLAASQFASEAARLSATIDPHANEQTQEANYKHAVSLLQSANEDPTRRDTAKDIFNRLQQESGERWPIYAKTQLFGMELLSGNDSEAQRIIAEFEEREVNFRQIAVVLPEQVRAKVLQESRRQFGSFNSWYSYAPDRSRKLRLARFIETMISGVPSAVSTLKLMRAYMLEDNLVAATQLADEEIARGVTNAELAQDVAWVLRVNRRYGESHRFLDALLEKSQIDGNDWAHRLLIDKSMTLASEERFDEALAVLGDVLANASRAKVDEQSDVPRVQLIRGFVLQDLGRAAEAAQAWSEGFRSLPMVGNEHRINNHADAIYCWLLAGLSNEVQGDELNQIVSQLAERFGSQHAIVTTVNMLGRDRIGRAMMECINTPRGYRIARDVAYQNQSLADLVSDLPVLLASFIIAKQIAPEGMSPKQDELLWKLGKAYFKSIFQDGQLSFSQLGVIGGAWQLVRGTGFAELAATTAWGSADVTLQKHPQLHGPSAYFFGLRTNSNSIKQMCFQRALSCANDNQTLRELVQAEIEAE